MYGILEAPPRERVDSVAGLVRCPENLEAPAAKAGHLGHERHRVETTLRIERGHYVLDRSHFDPVPRVETQSSGGGR